jgi:hypothetical protein
LLVALLGSWSWAPECRAELFGVLYSQNSLIRINETTGAGTLIGPLSNGMTALDLASSGGNLFTFDQINDRVRQLDPTTGSTLATIDIGIATGGEGGFAMRDDGTGFLSSTIGAVGTLWRFDITVPNSSLVTAADGLAPSMDGLAFDANGVLFGLSQGASDGGNKLYTIDPNTGATTLIGPLGVGSSALGGLAFASDGTLYATISGDGISSSAAAILYRLSTSTGAATLVGNIGFNSVSGITFAPIPEPGASALLGLGGLVLCAMRRRQRRADVSAT